ncbi:MAG: hypothetical protein PUJ51_17220 [Clostridiales bacterium]|uniref:hypothetical protein n=1 Tax=Terrisporobacter sp. TaxID=1965305 RepID=UPI002A4BBE35|nr:hypothetical protein [Terrisporobacter sp.]MCI5629411.1 hypothetical protein [Clostridium sp.]MDD5879974.1 hypothetical protein [Clostridiales bacterium]MCI6456849.1 hypothetical protein [Clostridium sp.]MCI7204654.1 hypothetical protein [Clostridium sp.]MDD7756231.1 hypothetical protein [Clostridiales bacterium]
MNEIMELINRKFLKDTELLYLEDHPLVKSCIFSKPHNAHYNEYLVVIDNNGQDEEYIVCCKFK